MTVTFPIVAVADGEVLDPQWIADVTEAVNDLHDDVTDLELLTTAQSASSVLPSSSIGTSITAVLTLSGCVLGAGRAYSIENIGGSVGSSGGVLANYSLWKTVVSTPPQIGAFYRTRTETLGVNHYGKIYMRNTASTPLTVTLVLGLDTNTGTCVSDADTIRPRALVVTDVGPAASWPFAPNVT